MEAGGRRQWQQTLRIGEPEGNGADLYPGHAE